ncbi:MAG: hypothetical protein PHN82_09205 [bacterium]|nr:hypothetical protein [bacterium]
MRRWIGTAVLAAGAAACAAQSTDPVGPAGWTTRNWAGFCLQIAVFILAVAGISRLAGRGARGG